MCVRRKRSIKRYGERCALSNFHEHPMYKFLHFSTFRFTPLCGRNDCKIGKRLVGVLFMQFQCVFSESNYELRIEILNIWDIFWKSVMFTLKFIQYEMCILRDRFRNLKRFFQNCLRKIKWISSLKCTLKNVMVQLWFSFSFAIRLRYANVVFSCFWLIPVS